MAKKSRVLCSSDSNKKEEDFYGGIACIEKIVSGGWGLFRDPFLGVCFIAGVLPGESIRFQSNVLQSIINDAVPIRKGQKYRVVQLEEIIERSPDRVEEKCVHYFLCGGCDWQHIAHRAQLVLKEKIVLENLVRLAKRKGESLNLQEKWHSIKLSPLFSMNNWAYRQRAKFVFGKELGQEKALRIDEKVTQLHFGFRKRNSREALAVPYCEVVAEGMIDRLHTVGESAGKKQIVFNRKMKNRAAEQTVLVFSSLNTEKEGICIEEDEFTYCWTDLRVKSQARLFFQSNAFVLPLLLGELTRDFGSRLSQFSGAFFDLYAGVGLFSVLFSRLLPASSRCFAVERHLGSFQYLQENVPHSFECHCADIGQFLQKKSRDTSQDLPGSFIFIDPSRSGLSAAVSQYLLQSGAKYILYLSCDAASFARDCGLLIQTYFVEYWRLVDFYPQTHHIELYALFTVKE